MKIKFHTNKVLVTKGEQDQYDIQVFEEGEDVVQQDEFSDDYDSDELSVPEEREADEYVYSDPKEPQESEGSGQQDMPQEVSFKVLLLKHRYHTTQKMSLSKFKHFLLMNLKIYMKKFMELALNFKYEVNPTSHLLFRKSHKTQFS